MPLFLNDIAGSEILLILIFILIFFGSKSIPGIAKTFGKVMYQIKEAKLDVQNEIKKSGLDIKKEMNFSNIIHETTEQIQRPLDQYVSDMDHAISYTSPKKQPNTSQIEPENQTSFETPKPLDQQLDA